MFLLFIRHVTCLSSYFIRLTKCTKYLSSVVLFCLWQSVWTMYSVPYPCGYGKCEEPSSLFYFCNRIFIHCLNGELAYLLVHTIYNRYFFFFGEMKARPPRLGKKLRTKEGSSWNVYDGSIWFHLNKTDRLWFGLDRFETSELPKPKLQVPEQSFKEGKFQKSGRVGWIFPVPHENPHSPTKVIPTVLLLPVPNNEWLETQWDSTKWELGQVVSFTELIL